MSAELINGSYIVAAVLFIFGLKQMSSPATAVRGNLLSAIGMLLAHYVPFRAIRAGEQLSDSKGASAALTAVSSQS